MAKAKPQNDAPFIYNVSPDTFLGGNHMALQLIAIERILGMMASNPAQTLYDKYVEAFKSTIRQLVSEHKIMVASGAILLVGPGLPAEVLANQKPTALAKKLKFEDYMKAFDAEKKRQAK